MTAFTYAGFIASILASDVNAVSSEETRRAAIETLDMFDAIDDLIAGLEAADVYAADPESTLVMRRVA